ncbi:MAG TPA: hypothetical protein PKL57_07855, partial [Candidatus Wallbacteria bacterium]|nr:hypothetical protein [Candidatus Wallbacteria bacterium]
LITPKVPESFKVLVSELQSLGLKIELQKNNAPIPLKEEIEAKLPKPDQIVAEIAQETDTFADDDDDEDDEDLGDDNGDEK